MYPRKPLITGGSGGEVQNEGYNPQARGSKLRVELQSCQVLVLHSRLMAEFRVNRYGASAVDSLVSS